MENLYWAVRIYLYLSSSIFPYTKQFFISKIYVKRAEMGPKLNLAKGYLLNLNSVIVGSRNYGLSEQSAIFNWYIMNISFFSKTRHIYVNFFCIIPLSILHDLNNTSEYKVIVH